jgi:dehydrogenase/reductase SDR family protein 1
VRTALVTGASRGLGRGTAIALSHAGYRVFATGRSIAASDLPDSVSRIACDHVKSDDTRRVFETVASEAGSLELLVNCAWGGYEKMSEDGKFTWPLPFWEQPAHRWSAMMDAGLRAAFECSARAARMMVPQSCGLIVNIGFWAAQKYLGNTIYGIAKAATDKMTADMAIELKPHGVAAISLYPGLVRTELVLKAAEGGAFDLANSESTEFCGRVIAALMDAPDLMSKTGRVLVAADLARERGVRDIDGSLPKPLSLADV